MILLCKDTSGELHIVDMHSLDGVLLEDLMKL